MTDANEMYDSNMNYLVSCDTDDDTKEEQDNFSLYEEAEIQDADYIPPSLLSYFETSKNRAAVCEKLLLEETEDFPASHHTENLIKLPIELNKDMMKVNQQVICEAENEDNRSVDTRLLPAPTETETLFTHSVSVSHNNEDEAGANTYIQSAKHLTVEMKTLEISLNEEKRKRSIKFEAEQEKRHSEEMKREERRRLIETDFQEEQRKIIEAEQLHQKALELMERRTQEKLEQEFLLQQELISNLKQRVEEERRMIEEEQKRLKDEEDKRKREEEKNKIEAERKRMKEETRRKKEEERKAEEAKLEEKKKKMEAEEKKKRKREEERKRIDLEKKELEDKMRMTKEEEERKMKEEVKRMKKEEQERAKKEEERTKIEAARMEMEKEKRIIENAMRSKKEDEEEKRKKSKEVHMRTEEVERVTAEMKERKKQEELEKRMEEEEADERKETAQQEMYEMRKRDKGAHGNVDEGIKLEEKRNNEEGDKKTREEEKKEEARTMENEGKKTEEKDMKEVVRKQEKENKKMKEELRSIKEDEERKKEDGRKTKEEEQRRRQKEDRERQRDEEDSKKSEEERFKEDNECYKIYDIDEGTMGHESKKQDKDKKQREEGKNVEAEKEQSLEEVREKKREVDKKVEEDIKLKEKEESKNRIAQDTEMEVIRIRAAEVQEKKDTRENSKIDQKEKTENSSQREDRSTWISNLIPLQSTVCPTRPEAKPRHHDQDKNISQTSAVQTAACENQAARLSTEFLPEHTEQKRLSWMKDCISWSKLSLQNRRKQKGSVCSRRGQRRPADACGLPPLCMDSVLLATGWKSLQEVTTVTLQDLPGCSLSTLAQCTRLQLLSLRRCGLRSLEGINQLPQLCHIDVQENDITFIDCENMTSLRILRLGHNKLTSIHGLTGAENVDVLDLSHNFITRIAGLESVRSLQRLSVDHNQLISTRGLRDVYTLVHLNCSHNHLASVEGLENSALLNTLDLRANSLTEPPSLSNQVLLRELYLDDNSISSLQGLAACWLPLMQHLSVVQNRITELPSMSNSVSLANLDLRFNCMSELQNVCKSLEGCQSLRGLHLTGNPLQQERGWRSTLQKALPGLRAVDNQETDSSLSPPAVQQVSLASGSFRAFCQAQLQHTRDLQQRQNRELSEASSSLDSVKISCRHFKETLQLATEQRFAHEYGDTTVPEKHKAADQTIPEETLDMDRTNAEKQTECLEIESTGKVPPVSPNRDNIRCRYWTSEEKSAAESRCDTFDNVTTRPKTESALGKGHSGVFHPLETKPKNISCNREFSQQNLDLQNSAAVVIQQLWRKHRQKCGNISSSSTAEKGGGRGGDGAKPESGPSYINGSVVGQDYAATVIQAFWRGFTLRKRLASALAAVTHTDTREDDTLEEVDVDEFIFDEAVLERHWIVPLPADLSPIRYPASEKLQSVKPPGSSPEPPHYKLHPPRVCRSKQAWVAGEEVDSAGQRVSSVSLDRSSPASASAVSGLSERSERILEEWGFTNPQTALLMLKRAQNMKSKKQQQKRDPFVRFALFQNCSYQLDPVEARNRQAQHNRNDMKVRKFELRLQQAEKTERVKEQERARQWLHAQAARSDRDSESGHFLPEISSDILNGGRVQLVADPGYTQRQHQGSGLWANNRLAARPCTENNYPRRDSLGHAREEVSPPKRVTSAPSKKERISFRDNPVQLSGGWGGGKKRDRVFK